MAQEPLIAVFVDFENLALGARDMKAGQVRHQARAEAPARERPHRLQARLLRLGQLPGFHQASFTRHGVEMVDIPQTRQSGKNSADIHMVVDALDLCYAKQHIDIFALLSGDSDFSPLVSKLKENNKRVIGCGVKSSTSDLLIGGCDEFIYYDDLARVASRRRRRSASNEKKAADPKDEARDRLVGIVDSLSADYDELWGSMVKQALKRVYPNFSESYYGYGNFSELLKDCEDKGRIRLQYDKSRGNYLVSGTD